MLVFDYTAHYLDVCRFIINLQVMCANMCQRSYLPTTYVELMSHTLRNCVHAQNFLTTSPYNAYITVFQHALNLYKTYP